MISRTRRWNVRYAHAHSVITTKRLRKPISQKMWRKSQNSQARNPDIFSRTDVGDRRPAADGRHVAVVAVAERLERLARDRAQDVLRRVRALLHRHLRDAGQRLAILHERADVADDEDVRMAGERQRRLGVTRPARSSGTPSDLRERRRRHAGRPENGFSGHPLDGVVVCRASRRRRRRR